MPVLIPGPKKKPEAYPVTQEDRNRLLKTGDYDALSAAPGQALDQVLTEFKAYKALWQKDGTEITFKEFLEVHPYQRLKREMAKDTITWKKLGFM